MFKFLSGRQINWNIVNHNHWNNTKIIRTNMNLYIHYCNFLTTACSLHYELLVMVTPIVKRSLISGMIMTQDSDETMGRQLASYCIDL